MKKLMLFLLFVLPGALLAGFYFYLNHELLPVKFRSVLEQTTKERFGHEITFKKISYNPLVGLVLENVTLTETRPTPIPSINVDRIQLQFPLLSILQKQELIITRIHLEHPQVHLRRAIDGHWQFYRLNLDNPGGGNSNFLAEDAKMPLLGGITVNNGKLTIIDEAPDHSLELILEDIVMDLELSESKGINVVFRSRIPQDDGRMDFDISYHRRQKSFDGQTHLVQLQLNKILPLLPKDLLPLTLNSGLVELADLRWETLLGDSGHFKDIRQWQIDGAIALRGTTMTFRPHSHYVGDIMIQNGSLSSSTGENLRGTMERAQLFGDLRIAQMANFRGLLQGDQLSFYKENGTFAVLGDLASSKAQWQLPKDITIDGDFKLQSAKYVQDPQKKVLLGSLTYPEAVFQFGDYITGRGGLRTEPFTLIKVGDHVDMQLAWAADNLRLKRWDTVMTGNFSVDSEVIKDGAEPYRLSAQIDSEDVKFTTSKGLEFTALPRVVAKVAFDPSGQSETTYSGSMMIKSGRLIGAGPAGEISGINGELTLENSVVAFKQLELNLLGTPLTLDGVYRFADRVPLVFRAQTSDVDVSSWSPMLAAYLKGFSILPGGHLGLALDYAGPVHVNPSYITQVYAQLHGLSLAEDHIPSPIENLTGLLSYDRTTQTLTTENLSGQFHDMPFSVSMNIRNLETPSGSITLKSEDLNFSTEFYQQGRRLNIRRANVKLHNSSANIYGAIPDRHRKPWTVDLTGSLRLETADLVHLPLAPKQRDKLKELALDGVVTVDSSVRGPIDRWRDAMIDIKAASPRLTIKSVPVSDWILNAHKRPMMPDVQLDTHARIDTGIATLSTFIQPDQPGIPGQTEIRLQDIRLSRLKAFTPLKSKNWDGAVDLVLKLDGPLTRLRYATGGGRLMVRDGYLGKTELLKGLWKVLLLAPGLENALFTQASAQVEIRDEKIHLNNMLLQSRPVDLFGEGYVGFDKTIDFYFKPSFKESEILSTRSVKTGPSSLLASLADQNIGIRVTGTLSKPQYDKSVLPGGVIKKVTGGIFEGVTGIFEEILE